MTQITAWFVGGPKHGDVVRIADAREIRIPVSDGVWRDTNQWVSEGRHDYRTDSYGYKTGIYRDSGELYGMPGLNARDRNRLFVWQGVQR